MSMAPDDRGSNATGAAEDQAASYDDVPREQEVRRALKQAGLNEEAQAPAPVSTKHKLWFVSYIVALLGFAVAVYAIRLGYLDVLGPYTVPLQRLMMGGIYGVFALLAARLVRVFFIERLESLVARYNLNRVLHLVTGIVIALIVLSVLFANWYTAALSLGLISLILGFALQTPITSFIGWVYILIREPYRVGDRIQMGEAKGDVIDVSYLDTTLWEFGGKYVSTDHPSGRIIKFPNSRVLTNEVYNYSWPLFPYIWNEIILQIAYQSDLKFVSDTMLEITTEELGEDMMARVRQYRSILAGTPVDQLEVKEKPAVLFRASANTWIEAIVRYLVHPKGAGSVKSRLTRLMIERLSAQPERVMFPKGDAR